MPNIAKPRSRRSQDGGNTAQPSPLEPIADRAQQEAQQHGERQRHQHRLWPGKGPPRPPRSAPNIHADLTNWSDGTMGSTSAQLRCQETKKADVAEYPKVFDHVGLLTNEPLGTAEMLSIQSSDNFTGKSRSSGPRLFQHHYCMPERCKGNRTGGLLAAASKKLKLIDCVRWRITPPSAGSASAARQVAPGTPPGLAQGNQQNRVTL